MSRVAYLTPEELSPEQKRVHDEIAGPRAGAVRGPFAVWLRTPRIADAANRLGNAVRLEGKLDRRLFELAILMVARHWNAQYEWFVHEKDALAAGVRREVIEAVRHRGVPDFAQADEDADEHADEKLVHDIVSELHATRTISQASYDRAVAALGLDMFIELMTTIGFYTTAAMMINAFDAPVPGNARPLP
jgi:4-carboxymuconolactone decarboxylase